MTGTFFNYEPGHIDAKFFHSGNYDAIDLKIRMYGDVTTTTELNEDGSLDRPIDHKKDSVEFSVTMTSVFCPFGDFLRFLEAIATEVQNCGFGWDAEGPDFEMQWTRRGFDGTGFLTVSLTGNEPFSYRMMLDTKQTVKALYGAFRSFVESQEYDPLRYEELQFGTAFALVISDASTLELAEKLAALSAEDAEHVIERIRNVVAARREKGPQTCFSIEHYFLDSVPWNYPNDEGITADPWIVPEWSSLSATQRINVLQDQFASTENSWYGRNLRELRSQRIEQWIAEHQFPPRKKYPTPLKAD
jgi:hypothetical protein